MNAISRSNIAPYLDKPIAPDAEAKVDAWLQAVTARLESSFGPYLLQDAAPAVFDIVASAISRRLTRGAFDPRLRAQSTGPSSVTYNTDVSALTGWFLPTELADLVTLYGKGGNLTSVRTPAPDAVRFGNPATEDWDDEDRGWYPL